MQTNRSVAGFTLIEVLVTVGVMALLASVVIVGVNPARQISNTRNAQRTGNIANIQGAINHYAIETFTGYPTGIDSTFRMIGTAASGCAVSCGPETLPPPPPTGIASFADDSQSEFDAGTHTNTQWSAGNSSVQLSGSGLAARTGTFLSKIFNAGSSATWNAFSYMPRAPYGKELLNSAVNESGYPTNNMSMANNVLLMHLNESSGSILDTSGNANNGTVFGTVTYGAAGSLRNALSFNGGANNYVRVNNAANLNLPNTGGTVMLWIKPTITSGSISQNSGMGILRKPDYAGNLVAPGGYGLEIYRNLTSNPANIKMSLGYNDGNQNSIQSLTGTTNILNNTWYHVAINWNAGTMNIYVNGVLDATATRTTGPLSWRNGTEKLYIGHNGAAISGSPPSWYTGSMDEIAIFGRQLSPAEIMSSYQRGAFHPKIRIRSCNDAACSGETFIGPDGTAGTYFSDESNTTPTPPSSTPSVPANQYFQYQTILDTDSTLYGPEITNVSGSNNGSGGAVESGTPTTDTTAEACLDLTAQLTPTFITSLPFDPQTGSLAKSYYAVRKVGMDGITVRACSPELGKSIQVVQ